MRKNNIIGIEKISMKRMEKRYVLKKDCPRIYKEAGDYYNNEFAESIDELIAKGVIEEEIIPENYHE